MKRLLRNTQNQWIKLETINYLLKWEAINIELAKEKLLEIATQEKDDMQLKVKAAELVASLGAVEQSIQILREMIMATYTNGNVKDQVFSSLETIYRSKMEKQSVDN